MAKLRLSSSGKLRRFGTKLALLTAATASAPAPSPAPAPPPPAAEPATTFTINEFLDQRVFQRVGTSRLVDVAGTYANGSPAAVQVRVVAWTNGATVVDWTTISTSPSGGAWSGQVIVPQGGWYKLQVRDSAGTAAAATGANRWGVGLIVGLIGQSNINNMPDTAYQSPLGYSKAVEWTGTTYTRVGNIGTGAYADDSYANATSASAGSNRTVVSRRGDGFVYLANLLSQSLNVPVCVVEQAEGGSAISQWQNGQTLWTRFANAVRQAAKGSTSVSASDVAEMEMTYWGQGEQDAGSDPVAYYTPLLANIHNQCLSISGRTAANFKFGITSLPTVASSSTWYQVDGKFGRMRVAQVAYATGTAGAFLAACQYDTAAADGIHLTGEHYAKVGRRLAKTGLAALAGTVSAGPRITTAIRSGAVITFSVEHSGGTALMDEDGGSGAALQAFRVYVDGVKQSGFQTAIVGNTVVVTLAQVPAAGTVVTADYGYGNVPSGVDNATSTTFVAAGVVCDNDTYYLSGSVGLPLQPWSGTVTGS